MTVSDPNKVPTAARWLGGLGLVPFAGLAAGAAFADPEPRHALLSSLLAYGASVLSFLGGIHWGLAISQSRPSNELWQRLSLSVLPSLIAWSALMTRGATAFGLLSAGLVVMLWIDLRATRAGITPSWYPRLRWPLSTMAVLSLLVGASLR
jgi:hypothetical protein